MPSPPQGKFFNYFTINIILYHRDVAELNRIVVKGLPMWWSQPVMASTKTLSTIELKLSSKLSVRNGYFVNS